jgi:hypothetical protein
MGGVVVAHVRIADYGNFGNFCRVTELVDNDRRYRPILRPNARLWLQVVLAAERAGKIHFLQCCLR